MSLGFCSFSSGSSGNSYLICSRKTALLVDAGISARKIVTGIESCGIEAEDVSGLLITHEHIDHVKSIKTLTKKIKNIKVYANRGTWSKLESKDYEARKEIFITGEKFFIEDIEIHPFRVSHDAVEPCGYAFSCEGHKISIVTDTGYMTDEIHDAIKNSEILVLEANHDAEILKMGEYPWNIKQRILGEYGHLSNISAGEALLRFLRESRKFKPKFFLAHMSRQNNFPEIAFETVKATVEEGDYYIDRDFYLELLLKDEFTGLHWV